MDEANGYYWWHFFLNLAFLKLSPFVMDHNQNTTLEYLHGRISCELWKKIIFAVFQKAIIDFCALFLVFSSAAVIKQSLAFDLIHYCCFQAVWRGMGVGIRVTAGPTTTRTCTGTRTLTGWAETQVWIPPTQCPWILFSKNIRLAGKLTMALHWRGILYTFDHLSSPCLYLSGTLEGLF